jgi:hypothetical protein
LAKSARIDLVWVLEKLAGLGEKRKRKRTHAAPRQCIWSMVFAMHRPGLGIKQRGLGIFNQIKEHTTVWQCKRWITFAIKGKSAATDSTTNKNKNKIKIKAHYSGCA